MDNLQVFNNDTDNFSVRTIDDNGNIWFVAKDILTALDYSATSTPAQIMQAVPEIWKGIKRIDSTSDKPTARPYQDVLCLTEQGVYFFLGRSDKPKALPYQMWIAGEVVPSIRKHGVYMTPQAQEELLSDPDFIIRLAQELKAERSKVKALQAQAEIDKPKVIFADAVDASKNSILIGNLAKILAQNGVKLDGKPIGQNKLYEWLRDEGYLMACKGERWNLPTQLSMNLGLFEVKKVVINNPDGTTKITHTTKVTGKGQIYFTNLFLKDFKED